MRALLALIDRIGAAAAVLAAVCLALMAIFVLAEVTSLALFNHSLQFTWEVSSFLMAAAFFLGLPWTLNSGGHVRVQLLKGALPASLRPALDLLATVVALAIALFLTYALATLALSSWADGSRTFTATATPLVIPQGVVALGAALLSLQLLARAIRIVMGETPDTAIPPATREDA